MTESEIIKFHVEAAIAEGITIGIKHSVLALNQFLDKKVADGFPETINREELRIFLETYLKEWEGAKRCH